MILDDYIIMLNDYDSKMIVMYFKNSCINAFIERISVVFQ